MTVAEVDADVDGDNTPNVAVCNVGELRIESVEAG